MIFSRPRPGFRGAVSQCWPGAHAEFVAGAVGRWIAAAGARTAFIEPGSPREDGCIESFNARLRDELLDGDIFYSLN